jgi:hypothetical protein
VIGAATLPCHRWLSISGLAEAGTRSTSCSHGLRQLTAQHPRCHSFKAGLVERMRTRIEATVAAYSRREGEAAVVIRGRPPVNIALSRARAADGAAPVLSQL